MSSKKLKRYAGSILRRMGYEITPIKDEPISSLIESDMPYFERKEYGASNLRQKIDRVNHGLNFEWPDIVNLNNAVIRFLDVKENVVELGSGTGKFASIAAQDCSRFVVASEFDRLAYEWCIENIPKSDNLLFLNGPIPRELGPFDVSVSIEVIEHVKNYVGFLKDMQSLAPRSLITTPNRKRSIENYHAGPPAYFQHVREWTAGEFYWVLRCFWNDVRLYAMTSQTEPHFIKVNVDTSLSPLIADCRSPITIYNHK